MPSHPGCRLSFLIQVLDSDFQVRFSHQAESFSGRGGALKDGLRFADRRGLLANREVETLFILGVMLLNAGSDSGTSCLNAATSGTVA